MDVFILAIPSLFVLIEYPELIEDPGAAIEILIVLLAKTSPVSTSINLNVNAPLDTLLRLNS